MTLGICFIMMDALDETGTPDVISVESISLVNNQFAIDVSPMTFDESLKRCQFYYEKSYDQGVLPGTSDVNGIKSYSFPAVTDSTITQAYPLRFTVDFVRNKRAIPTMTFYTPTGTVANMSVGAVDHLNNVVSAAANKPLTEFTLTNSTVDRLTYDTNNTTTIIFNDLTSHTDYQAFMQFHFLADSRMGV